MKINKHISLDSDKLKLSKVNKILTDSNQKKDSIQTKEILNDCKDRNLSCKYELFKLNYTSEPILAFQLIREIALQSPIKDKYDSTLILHARLIAADMSERGIGSKVDMKQSFVWYLLYFELQQKLKNRETENMIEEMYRVSKMLNKDEIIAAFKDAEIFLGKKTIFKLEYLDKEPRYFLNQERITAIQNIQKIFENYIKHEESTDSPDNKNLMTISLKSLTKVSNSDDLELLINVWMYYDPTDFPSRELVLDVLKKNKLESIEAVKTRIKRKKKWESLKIAPYSELYSLLKDLYK